MRKTQSHRLYRPHASQKITAANRARATAHVCSTSVLTVFFLWLSFSGILTLADTAYAKAPKWYVREALGKPEKELSGTLKLKPKTEPLTLNLYLENAENKDLADHCHSSHVEGVSISGGEPGKAKIKKLEISGCEEGLAEPCTVKSSTEKLTFENLSGELVYRGAGDSGPVAIRFEPVEASIGVACKSSPRCPGMGTIEKIRTEFCPM